MLIYKNLITSTIKFDSFLPALCSALIFIRSIVLCAHWLSLKRTIQTSVSVENRVYGKKLITLLLYDLFSGLLLHFRLFYCLLSHSGSRLPHTRSQVLNIDSFTSSQTRIQIGVIVYSANRVQNRRAIAGPILSGENTPHSIDNKLYQYES